MDGRTDVSIMIFLLQHGAEVNERQFEKLTALDYACESFLPDPEKISVLLENGADINSLDKYGDTPLTRALHLYDSVLIKHLAEMRFEDRYICPENLEYLQQNTRLQNTFKDCLEELRKMKYCQVSKGLSMYDIFSLNKIKKMTVLTRNEDFLANFESLKEQFKYYVDRLEITMEIAQVRGADLMMWEDILYSALKNHLPALVINKITYFLLEDEIFYEYIKIVKV